MTSEATGLDVVADRLQLSFSISSRPALKDGGDCDRSRN